MLRLVFAAGCPPVELEGLVDVGHDDPSVLADRLVDDAGRLDALGGADGHAEDGGDALETCHRCRPPIPYNGDGLEQLAECHVRQLCIKIYIHVEQQGVGPCFILASNFPF